MVYSFHNIYTIVEYRDYKQSKLLPNKLLNRAYCKPKFMEFLKDYCKLPFFASTFFSRS